MVKPGFAEAASWQVETTAKNSALYIFQISEGCSQPNTAPNKVSLWVIGADVSHYLARGGVWDRVVFDPRQKIFTLDFETNRTHGCQLINLNPHVMLHEARVHM